MAIFTILYGNYYPPHGEFKLICIGKFARRTWVTSLSSMGKIAKGVEKINFTMLHGNYCYIFIEKFPQKSSPCRTLELHLDYIYLQWIIAGKMFPHNTKILRKYCKNISWKYCKIAKILRNVSLILLKYCNNLAMSAQNMTYAIFSKYCQN